ncbi:hypothetical protein [Paenibacillus radicis (ex Xue et al. 2023)]|uniref:C1q domain-containing protein n=1 Tax=Paenibacillus radicis (ex Xue et al. 2023) TaxID=2972489 RepID=A0ABT1YRD5_9BACL|nr:hypothetical protein [Paenibacillus radicis (ex Xue et al. 2023)]MCR8635741.1 hypothetical protein [Paenibacillus radicis (ex Xue et al. 2023)]
MTQQTMYPAVPNSPQTELSAAITNVVTTVPVVNAALLPAAPNLATIGTDDTAETILYTGKSGNSLTGVTRGFQGSAKSWSTGAKVARYFTAYDHDTFKGNIEDVANQIKSSQLLTTNLIYGLQAVNADQAGPVDLGARGQTRVNFFERWGRGESLNSWLFAGGVLSVDPTVFSNGTTSLKALIPTGTSSSTVSVRRLTPTVDPTKHYLFLADIKNTSWSSYYLYAYGSAISGSSYGSAKNGFRRHYLKLTPAQIAVTTHLSVYGSASGDNYLNTSSWSLYEISASDYAKIDVDPEFTGDKLAAKYPYTEGITNVNGLYVTKSGKNLLPPFNEWTVNGPFSISSPYSTTLIATASNQQIDVKIPALGSTLYNASCAVPNGAVLELYEASSLGGTFTFIGNIAGDGTFKSRIFTTAASTTFIQYKLIVYTSSGTFIFTNPTLNLGSTAAPFEPKSDQYIYVPNQQLSSSVDGSVYDTIYKMGNKYYKESRFKRMDLDGSLAWTFDSDPIGFKRVKLDLIGVSSNSDDSLRTVKYDGAMIKFDSGSLLSADFRFYNAGISKYFITIADTESGWGETYAPSAAEIKAYFYGWRMYQWGNPTNVPYSSGTKAWVDDLGGAPVNGGTQTLPTSKALNYKTPYKLQYQLTSSTIEEIAVEGDLALHEGGNQIEVGSGLIVREKANPLLYASGLNRYYLNDTAQASLEATKFKNKTERIIAIYKDNNNDTSNWIITTTSVYGKQGAYCPQANFDTNADYYVTYIALDQYGITCNPTDVSIQYGANMATVVSNLAQDLADNTTRDSVQDWLLLQDGAYLDNLRLDIDAHRNASTAHGSTSAATASTIMQRDAAGQANVGTPTVATHIARKQETDVALSAAQAAQTTANAALPATSYTAADILTKIKTVDGEGSGLDADTLGGLNKTSFVRSGIRSYVKARTSASQSLPNITATQPALNTEDADTRSEFDTSTYTFTAQETGIYIFKSVAIVNLPSAGTLRTDLYVNNVNTDTVAEIDRATSGNINQHGSTFLYLTSGDTVKMYVTILGVTGTGTLLGANLRIARAE